MNLAVEMKELIALGDKHIAHFKIAGLEEFPELTENFTGMTWEAIQSNNSGMEDLVKFIYLALGIMMFGYFLLYLAIVSVGYRKGETGTWYASWTLPLMLIAFTIGNNRGHGGEWPMFIVLLIVSLLGLLLPIRKFFPRKSSVKS